MKKLLYCAFCALVFLSPILTVHVTDTINGLPDGKINRIKWLFEQIGVMPKGLVIALVLFAAVAVCTAAYAKLVSRGGAEDGKE